MKGSLVTTFLMLLSLSAGAQQAAPRDSDKLDLKKLEDKYWAAKDTDFSVVQNRTYAKAGRAFANVSYGVLVNDPSTNGRLMNIAAGYYFSERFGLEVSHQTGQVYDNDATGKYKEQYTVWPDYNKFKSYTSLNALWVPFYAKMSFLDRKIVYFDMQFGLGVGNKKYDMIIHPTQGLDVTASTMGYNFDFTQQLFFSEHFSIRMDLKNQWSKQERKRSNLTGSQTEADRALPSNLINDTSLMFGLTYFY